MKINNLKLKSNSVVQQKKFYNLLKEKRSTQDPEKVIFNFSKYVLSDCEKSLLTKGLNFSIPCKKLDYADYLVQFELFFRDTRDLDVLCNEDLDFVKTKTKEAALSSYRSYNNNVPQNLYIKKMDDILSDQKQFRKVSLIDDTLLNSAIN